MDALIGLPGVSFDPVKLSEHARELASEEFAGRAPATEGEARTIAYLSTQFAALGLESAGDGWTQEVPMRKFEWAQPAKVTFKGRGSASELKLGEEVAMVSLAGETDIDIEERPLVFVGYGITAPELGWDDFKGVDLRGKVAVFLINDPDFEEPVWGRFGGKAMTYYGRWTYKREEAARRGAMAALIVHEEGPAAQGWPTIRNSWSAVQLDLVRSRPRETHPLLQGWLRRDVAVRLFQQAGLDLDLLKQRAMRPDFVPVEFKGATLSVQGRLHITPVSSHNVIARLPGRQRPHECILYGAHWDHLGIGNPDSTGDHIYHGAIDNATAVAGLLELARVFASAPRTARSVYFVAFTAEEKGLLGSEYYALHPPSALECTAAVFNMELMGIGGPACDVSVWGNVRSILQEALSAAAAMQGRVVSPDPHLEAGYFYRSDHFPFARRGVPAITVTSGRDLCEGGITAGQKAYEEYMTNRYHQPADRWSPELDLRGLALDLEVLYQAGRGIADALTWPQWDEGSGYQRIREQSAKARAGKGCEAADESTRD